MAGLPWIRAYTSIRTDPRSLVLGRLLGDSHAYARILDLRLWLADNSPSGRIEGPHADIVVEEAVGWRGEPGAFAKAATESGFLRESPAREGCGRALEDADWVDEQSAHIAKVERDRAKPDGRSKSLRNPVRLPPESRAAPVRDSCGESRELRVETKTTASQGPADAVPTPEQEDLPDATEDATPVGPAANGCPDCTALAPCWLHLRDAVPAKGPKPPRQPSKAEAAYAKFQEARQRACEAAGVAFVPDRWHAARINKDLGAILRGGEEEQGRFVATFEEYLGDESMAEKGWSLSYLMSGGVRSKYEQRALRGAA